MNTDDTVQALLAEIAFDFVRSSGPGGQNVNKVATAAQLRFDIGKSFLLSDDAKTRLVKLGGRRVTADGVLVIVARRYRTQDQNRADAMSRFEHLVRAALEKHRQRLPTRATAASREKRLKSKKRKGEIKRARRQHFDEP